MLSIDDINYSLMDPAKAGAVSCIETPVVKYMMISYPLGDMCKC
jgi:hypothetical protein